MARMAGRSLTVEGIPQARVNEDHDGEMIIRMHKERSAPAANAADRRME